MNAPVSALVVDDSRTIRSQVRHLLGENGERIAALAAATLLISAHVRNLRLCRAGDCDDSCSGES